MSEILRIALAQLDPCMGDIAGNLARAQDARAAAAAKGADIVLFSELFVTGYPPEDLVLKRAFQADAREAVAALAKETASGPAVLIGTPWSVDGKLYNAVALLDEGRVQAVSLKYDLPNYGVFDEKRVFSAGPLPSPLDVRGASIGPAENTRFSSNTP
jgi:NAD+ synthase